MEQWKDILGYEGLYQVSDMGRIKSLNYNHTGEERILKPGVEVDEYLRVNLCKNGKRKHHKIHRIVAQAFIPNPDGLPQVNHKNEVKSDNRVENLEWCTALYNNNYGSHNKRVAEANSIPVLQLNLNWNLIKKWNSTIEAAREGGFKQGAITRCCQGKLQKHHGYRWTYADEYQQIQPISDALF